MRNSLLSATALFLCLLPPAAIAREAPATAGDPTVCDFVLPGHFEEAVAKAKELSRPLIIKGVAFGVDKVGASCATKGKW